MGFAHHDERLPSELDFDDSAQKRHHRKRRLHINEDPAKSRTAHRMGLMRNDH